MISIFVCDDESVWLDRLTQAITAYQMKSDWEIGIAYKTTSPEASIIFVTTHDEMVMETFRLKLEVLDYIIKDGASVTEQVHQCLHHLEMKYLSLSDNKNASVSSAITICTAGSYYTFAKSEIYYVDSIKGLHKVNIHLCSAIYQASESLSSIQNRLGADFLQCHKTCLVNTEHIKSLDSSTRNIVLDNGESCPCSIREWKKVVQLYRGMYRL